MCIRDSRGGFESYAVKCATRHDENVTIFGCALLAVAHAITFGHLVDVKNSGIDREVFTIPMP